MSWLETARIGVEAILSHRLRSALTTLGILIGIAAVILTVGLGEGAQASVTSAISSLGTNLLVVSPGSSTTDGVRGGLGSASTLTDADASALASPVVAPDVKAVAPTVQQEMTLVAGSTNWTTTVVGSTPNWLGVRDQKLAEGSFFSASAERRAAAVTVLGPTTAEELFGFRDPVGQQVTIDGIPFTVDGVLAPSGSSASTTTSEDDEAVVPLSTAQNLLFGSGQTVQSILVEARSAGTLSAAYQEADNELLALHGITSPAAADFTITSEQSLISTATTVDRTLTVLLAGIAGISLLVGGIGVMNIMLVSVAERVREIGLRKALGATPQVIRRQFLVEASVLGLVGGILGIAVGLLGATVLPPLISDPITISPVAVVGAIAVSIVIGVGFGVYPAGRAARLAPIDALRVE